ncbi:MAG: hypothetical protein HUK02_04860 [Bacteroidaceae bacterium]|nr:hypothetical protein [Bacteroidaceae bacterium]
MRKSGSSLSLLLGSVVATLFAAAVGAGVYGTQADVLWKHYQRNLWMGDADYLFECLSQPGGLVSYVGRWLAEWLATPCQAAVVAAVGFGLLAVVVQWAFRLRGAVAFLSAAVVCALLANTVQLGYMLYVLKVAAPAFTPLVGTALAVVLFGITDRLPLRLWLYAVTVGVVGVLSYGLLGGYTLLYIALVVFGSIPRRGKAAWMLAALVMQCLIVAIWTLAPRVFTGLNPDLVFMAGLPDYLLTGDEASLWYPLYVAFGLLLALAVVGPWMTARQGKLGWIGQSLLTILVVAASVEGVRASTFSDPDFRATLRAEQAMERGDWQGVIREINAAHCEPTRAMVMLRGLALTLTGQSLDHHFQYADGSHAYRCPRQAQMLRLMLSRQLYFHYGKVNYSYRWTMEDKVEYGLSREQLRYFIRCSLLNGEWALAQKYIATLRRVPGSEAEAARYAALVGRASAVVDDAEFAHILPLMAYNNGLDGDGGLIEIYLLRNFGLMNGGGAELVELSLLANLIEKDADMFWRHLAVYARHHETLPRHLQEAALMWGQLQGIDITGLPIDEAVAGEFAQLVDRAATLGDAQAANDPSLRAQFGQTYWYYYFFVKNLKTN